MTEFSVICTTFLPFIDFISFYFDLSTNHVITIRKASLLARHDIDRMENWRPDPLTSPHMPLEMLLVLGWCISSSISDLRTSQKVFQFRRCILWNNEMRRKKRKIKLLNTESLQNQKPQSICCRQTPFVEVFALIPACSVLLLPNGRCSHGNSFKIANS